MLQVLPWTTAGVGVASAGYEHGSEIRQLLSEYWLFNSVRRYQSNIYAADVTQRLRQLTLKYRKTICWMRSRALRLQLTNHAQLSAGGILVQSGVGDAGVHARIALRHVCDGEAVGLQD